MTIFPPTHMSGEPNFTVLLAAGDGRTFTYSSGNSTPTTRYESASTSKWVTAATILEAIEQSNGMLTLDTTASSVLTPYWTEQSVTLRHLLAFTSGFSQEPPAPPLGGCVNHPNAVFADCVQRIYELNTAPPAPGTVYYYSSAHMQVAGLMTIRSMNKTSWTEVFNDFKTRTGVFPTSEYDLPSATNPRLAGGMHWTGAEYLNFLGRLYNGTLLSMQARAELFGSQRGNAVVQASPTLLQPPNGLGQDWAYGLGNWLECNSPNFNCPEGVRNSSPGAYGSYPFIDWQHGYYGIVARAGMLGNYPEGIAIFRAVQDLVDRWATRSCP